MPRTFEVASLFPDILSRERGYRLNLYLDIDAPGGRITVSDNAKIGKPIVLAWGTIAPTLATDAGALETQSFDVRLSNRKTDGTRIADDLDQEGIEGSTCTLYLFDPGPESWSTPKIQPIFKGTLQQVYGGTVREVSIRVDGRGAFVSQPLGRLVRDTYPQAPPDFATRLQPLLYGHVNPWPLTPVDVGVVSVLAEDLAEGATSAVIAEDIGRWPSSGTVQLGGDELATYSGKDEDTGTLTGLSRGAHGTSDKPHSAGDVVLQRPASYKFLVADRQYGPVGEPTSVSIAGKKISGSRWSFDSTTNLVTINTSTATSGRATYGHHIAQARGMKALMFGLARRTDADRPAGRRASVAKITDRVGAEPAPITSAAHGSMCAWGAPADTHFWRCHTDWDVDDAAGKRLCTSPVTLEANTPKTWEAGWFESYLPPSSALLRTGFSVALVLAPATRQIMGGLEWVLKKIDAQKIRCTVNGVVREWYPSGDDGLSAPDFGSTGASISNAIKRQVVSAQRVVFDFGTDVDPEDAPHAITLEAVCAGGITGPVGRVQALTQSVDGVMPWTANQGRCQAEGPSASVTSYTYTFDRSFEIAILSVPIRAACDYVKVDLGGGRIVRLTPPAFEDALLTGNDPAINMMGAWSSFAILVQNPGLSITVAARDHGRDNDDPVVEADSDKVSKLALGTATLTGLTSGSAAFPLLPPVKASSVFEIAFNATQPIADCWGYTRSEALNDLTIAEHPMDVVRHYLVSVLGEDLADIAWYSGGPDAGDYSDWGDVYKFAGGVTEQLDRRLPLMMMVRDARAEFGWDALEGKWRMKFRRTPATIIAGAADHAWGPGEWLFGAEVALDRSSSEQRVDRVNFRYLRDWTVLGHDLEHYGDAKSSGSGIRTADERYISDFVRSAPLAQILADFYAAWDSATTRRTGIAALIKELDVMKGDVIDLTVPIPGSDPREYLVEDVRFIVEAVGFQPHDLNSGTPAHVLVILQEVPA